MARMLTQVPLPLLPHDAAEIAPGVGVVAGPDGGGVVWVHGLATFAWDAGDEAARRLAAVQLVQLNAATQVQVAQAFGVIPVSVWRWAKALAGGGVAGLVPAVKGPQRASKLTPQVVARIRELDRQGAGKAAIAAAAGVSESSVRSVLRPARPAADGVPAGQDPADTSGSADTGLAGTDSADTELAGTDAGAGFAEPEVLPVLPDPVPRDGERALARFGLLGEGAAPVFTAGARYPLAGLLLALPPLAESGLLDCARQVYGRLRDGFYALEVMLVVLVFMALLREARAEGATRIPPAALGRVLGLDRAPEVKTIRRKLGELAAAGKAADLQLALARHHAAATPDALGFLYIDGHTRAYFGKRDIQKMHVTRLKFPGPATEETWVTGSAGDPLLVVMAQPSSSLAAQIRGLLPALREITGPGRKATLCFDRGGWSPALFADITDAGFDLLTYRKNNTGKGRSPTCPGPHSPGQLCRRRRPRRSYDLAGTTTAWPSARANIKAACWSLRQVTRRKPGDTRQVHILTTRPAAALPAAGVIYRMTSRWREENYFRYGRAHFALDALDTYAVTPEDPGRKIPNPAKKTAAAAVKAAKKTLAAAGPAREDKLAALRSPAPGQAVVITNPMLARLEAPVGCRPPRPGNRPGRRQGHARENPAPRAQPRHGQTGYRDQADHPRHPDGRLQHRDHLGPRPERLLRPGRRRSLRPDPRSLAHQRRHHHPRQRPAHPPRPAVRTPPHQRPRRALPTAQHHPGLLPRNPLTLHYEVKEHHGTA